MNAEFLRELLTKTPFVPFEVRLANRDVYEVRHPEFAFVLKTRMAIGYPDFDQLAGALG